MRALLVLAALTVVASVAGGCADGARRDASSLTVYASLPADGPSAAAGTDAELGIRHAFAELGDRLGEAQVRLVVLPATRSGGEPWSRVAVAENARRAAADPDAIAYLGELDQGGSSVSLPMTNRAGILQVSPADGLTSLGRMLPGDRVDRQRRYYPTGTITFVRVVPPDLDVAREIAARVRVRGTLVAVRGPGIAARELERLVVSELADEGGRAVRIDARRGSADGMADVAERVAAARPDAVLYAGPPRPPARALLTALAATIPGVPVAVGPPLAARGAIGHVTDRTCAWTGVPPRDDLTPRGRRVLEDMSRASGRELGVEALLGYAAALIALQAVADGGADRAAVVDAARRSVDRDEVAVGHGLGNRAHIEGLSTACVPIRAGRGTS